MFVCTTSNIATIRQISLIIQALLITVTYWRYHIQRVNSLHMYQERLKELQKIGWLCSFSVMVKIWHQMKIFSVET